MAAGMRRAGAIVLGKTNLDEFPFGDFGISSVGGTIGNAYDPSSGDATGSTLSGVVETTRTLEAGTRWTPRDGVDLSLDVVRSWIDNAGHVQDDDTRTWTLRLGARLRK